MDKNLYKKRIGGTDISAIYGCNPYKSKYRLWQEIKGFCEPIIDTPILERGRKAEHIVASIYELENDLDEGKQDVKLQHSKFDFLGGSPDRVYDDRILEVKTSDISMRDCFDFDAESPKIPTHYYMQIMWYAGISKINKVDMIVAFFRGNEFAYHKTARFEFDKLTYDMMTVSAVDFWRKYIENDEVPEITSPNERMEVFRQRYRTHDDGIIDDAEKVSDANRLIREYFNQESCIRHHQRRSDEYKAEIMELIGEHAGIKTDFGNVTFKKNKDSVKTDWQEAMMRLRERFLHSSDVLEAIDQTVREQTTIKEGSRVFRTPRVKEF